MKDSTIKPGDTIRDFRGQDWIFQGIGRMPTASTTGKLVVSDPGNPTSTREFYPSVFDLAIVNGEVVR